MSNTNANRSGATSRTPVQLAAAVVGAVVALDLVLAESPTGAVWLASATVYPSGIEFDVDPRA